MQGRTRCQSQHISNVEKKYLLRENRELKLQISELKQINDMHKNALTILSQKNIPHKQVITTLTNLIRSRPATRRDVALLKRVTELQSQMMVIEKIAEQASDSEKETYKLLVEQFQKLKEDNMRKDQSLNKFYQKIGEVDYLSGLVTKFVEVISPTEQAIAFQKEKQQLLDALNLMKEQVKRLSEQKEKLLKINVHLKQQLDRRKDDMRNMTLYINQSMMENQNEMILDELENDRPTNQSVNNDFHHVNISHGTLHNNLSVSHGNFNNYSMMNGGASGLNNSAVNSTLNFIKLQNELIKEDGAEDDSQFEQMEAIVDCPQLYHLFPDRVQQINSNRQRKRVPYLNMLKVRQLMAKRQNKLKKQMEQANANVNPTTKIIRLEGQLDITRKQLTSLMLKHRTVANENKLMTSSVEQLQARNYILLQCNERLGRIHQSLRQENSHARITIARIEAVTGRSLLNKNITEQEMANMLRATTRRNTLDQMLENVLVNQAKPLKRCASM